MKKCTECLETKSLDCFYKHHRNGFQNLCIECKKEYNRKHYLKNKEKYKKRAQIRRDENPMKKRWMPYWLSSDEVIDLFEKYNHKCWACWRDNELCIDHCHSTWLIRWILCQNCNRWLWQIWDTIEDVRNILKYLEG